MNFSFIDDPKWSTLDDITKQRVIDLAFERNIATDQRFAGLPEETKQSVRDIYVEKAHKYESDNKPYEKPELTWGRAGGAFKEGGKDVARSTANALAGATKATLGEDDTFQGLLESVFPPAQALRLIPEGWKPTLAPKVLGPPAEEFAKSKELQTSPEFLKSSGYIEDFIRSSPQMGSQILASVVGGPTGGMMFMGSQIAGGTYDDLVKKGIDPQRAFYAGLANAIIQAPLEQVGIGKITKLFKPQKSLFQRLKKIGEAAGTEWLTEFLQSFPDVAINIFAEDPDEGVIAKMDDFISRLPETAKQGAYEGLLTAPWALLGMAGGTSKIGDRSVEPPTKPPDPVKPIMDATTPDEAIAAFEKAVAPPETKFTSPAEIEAKLGGMKGPFVPPTILEGADIPIEDRQLIGNLAEQQRAQKAIQKQFGEPGGPSFLEKATERLGGYVGPPPTPARQGPPLGKRTAKDELMLMLAGKKGGLKEEVPSAEEIRKDEGQVYPGGVAGKGGEEKGGQDIQLTKKEGTEAGYPEERLVETPETGQEPAKQDKEFWEMTQAEYNETHKVDQFKTFAQKIQGYRKLGDEKIQGAATGNNLADKIEAQAKTFRRIEIAKAIKEGKIQSHPDYPDLTPPVVAPKGAEEIPAKPEKPVAEKVEKIKWENIPGDEAAVTFNNKFPEINNENRKKSIQYVAEKAKLKINRIGNTKGNEDKALLGRLLVEPKTEGADSVLYGHGEIKNGVWVVKGTNQKIQDIVDSIVPVGEKVWCVICDEKKRNFATAEGVLVESKSKVEQVEPPPVTPKKKEQVATTKEEMGAAIDDFFKGDRKLSDTGRQKLEDQLALIERNLDNPRFADDRENMVKKADEIRQALGKTKLEVPKTEPPPVNPETLKGIKVKLPVQVKGGKTFKQEFEADVAYKETYDKAEAYKKLLDCLAD